MTGEELRQWMTDHNYTVARLAEELGLTERHVYRWRAGDRAIPPMLVLALAQLTN